jgi:nucleoside-diphosphate-sugar epimerase
MARNVVLVSGAGGFIGRWSVPRLIAGGYEVHAVAARTPGRELPAQLSGAEIHYADLLREESADALMREVRPSHLLHFAWIATPGVYWTSPENRRWLAASQHLLQSFQGNGGMRAVMAGTCAEYDWSRAGVCNEHSSPLADGAGAAIAPYAECKIAMQRALATFGSVRHISTAWGRIFFQFGPDEHPDRLVASVIVNLLSGREALCTHGRQIRSFLHVADVGSAFAALLDSATEGPVNMGSPDRISVAGLLEEIGLQIGRPELLRFGARDAPPSEPPLLVPAVERLYNEVGWRPQFGLSEAIADTISWWRRKTVRGAGSSVTT